jgi:hypothetical protein
MKLNYTTNGEVKADMKDYMSKMLEELPEKLVDAKYPRNENLFKLREDDIKLSSTKKQIFHTLFAK